MRISLASLGLLKDEKMILRGGIFSSFTHMQGSISFIANIREISLLHLSTLAFSPSGPDTFINMLFAQYFFFLIGVNGKVTIQERKLSKSFEYSTKVQSFVEQIDEVFIQK